MSIPTNEDILKKIKGGTSVYGGNSAFNTDLGASSNRSSGLPSTNDILNKMKSDPGKFGIDPSSITSISDRISGKKSVMPDTTPEKKAGIMGTIKDIGGDILTGLKKLPARVGVEAANLATSTIDFAADLLANFVTREIRSPMIAQVEKDSKIMKDNPYAFDQDRANVMADKWVNFYENTVGKKTEEMKKFTQGLREKESLKPTDAWSQATLQEKFKPENIAETVLYVGPGVIASLGAFAINIPLGFAVSAGSVADDIKTSAVEYGVDPDKAERLGLGAGLLIGAIDKMVPDELFSPQEKGKFMTGVIKRILKTSLKETGTEIVQEDIQIAAEATFRDDIGLDEIATRNAMSGLGGFLGGAGGQMTVNFANQVRGGNIGGVDEETKINVEEKATEKTTEKTKAQEEELTPTEALEKMKQPVEGTPNIEEDVKEAIGKQKAIAKKAVDSLETQLAEKVVPETKKRFYQIEGKGETPWLWDNIKDLRSWADSSLNVNENVRAVDLSPDQVILQDNGAYIAKEGVLGNIDTVVRVTAEDIIKTPDVVKEKPLSTKEDEKTVRKIMKSERLVKVNEEQIKTTKNIKDVKSTLKRISVELEQNVVRAEALSIIAQEKRSGVNTKDIATLKRIYARSSKFQEGDIETIRAYSEKSRNLVNSVIENVQESHPNLDEQEAFDFALELPTQSEESPRNETISQLEQEEKKIRKFLKQLKDKQGELKIAEDDELAREWSRVLAVQEELSSIIKVPSTQMPVGEGKEKVSRLQARVMGKLDALKMGDIQKLKDELGLATYNQMNRKDQIAQATEFVSKNPEEAMRVMKGEINPPKGLLVNSIYAALKELGTIDTDIAVKLATLSSTRFGQEINILQEIDIDNPVTMMEDVVKTRIEAFEKRTGKKSKEKVNQEIEKINQEIKPPSKKQWSDFLESIRC